MTMTISREVYFSIWFLQIFTNATHILLCTSTRQKVGEHGKSNQRTPTYFNVTTQLSRSLGKVFNIPRPSWPGCICVHLYVRATSHKRLSARDHYTSSTLIGGKGEASPSLLRTTLEGPTEYVNARWMQSLHGFLRGIEWIMCHGYLEVGLTQNWETTALRTLTTVDLFYFITCEDMREHNINEITFG